MKWRNIWSNGNNRTTRAFQWVGAQGFHVLILLFIFIFVFTNNWFFFFFWKTTNNWLWSRHIHSGLSLLVNLYSLKLNSDDRSPTSEVLESFFLILRLGGETKKLIRIFLIKVSFLFYVFILGVFFLFFIF